MALLGRYVNKTLLHKFETRSEQRRVVVSFVIKFRLEIIFVASVIGLYKYVRSRADCSPTYHFYHDLKVTGQTANGGKSSQSSVGVVSNHGVNGEG